MLAILLVTAALSLVDGKPADVVGATGPAISGLYVEAAANGTSQCSDAPASAKRLEIYIRAEPPHPRSSNQGYVRYMLGGAGSNEFVVTTAPEPVQSSDTSQPASILVSGGFINTAGRYAYGISDGQTVGRAYLRVIPSEREALELIELSIRERRSTDTTTIVEDSRLADGTILSRFIHCYDLDEIRHDAY